MDTRPSTCVVVVITKAETSKNQQHFILSWCQVLSHGEERLQGPSVPQLDARLLRQPLLLPALQKPWALALPPVCQPLLLRVHEQLRLVNCPLSLET